MEIKSKELSIVSIDILTSDPKNENTHSEKQLEALQRIIKANGFREPLTVSNRSGFVICGNGRLEVAKRLGMTHLPVIYQDFDNEADELRHRIADNEIARYAELDTEKMLGNLKELNFDLENFNFEELGLLDFKLPEVEVVGLVDEDEVPELKQEPTTKRGDIWLLGNHRLMCGDSTLLNDIEILTPIKKIDMIYTDPPYGMNAVSKSGVLSKNYIGDIIGDDSTDAAKDSFNLAISLYPNSKHVWWGANYYSSTLPNSECWLVWDKNNGQSDQTDCELAWTNFRSVVRQFTQASEKTNRIHPTQKPVSLVEWCIEKSKTEISSMLDLFTGSGSSLIACEKNKIHFYGMELDPRYCDLIINRWQNFTGKKATLESNGKTYEGLKLELNPDDKITH